MFSCSADSRPGREGVYALVVLPTMQKAFLDKGAQEDGEVTYTITIPDVPPSLNVSRNLHWAAKARLRDKWILYVRSQMNDLSARPPGKRHVKVVLHHSRPYDECDNMQGACKPLFDALKHWRLIHDDSPEWIGKPDISQAKCPHKQRHTVIEIGEAA